MLRYKYLPAIGIDLKNKRRTPLRSAQSQDRPFQLLRIPRKVAHGFLRNPKKVGVFPPAPRNSHAKPRRDFTTETQRHGALTLILSTIGALQAAFSLPFVVPRALPWREESTPLGLERKDRSCISSTIAHHGMMDFPPFASSHLCVSLSPHSSVPELRIKILSLLSSQVARRKSLALLLAIHGFSTGTTLRQRTLHRAGACGSESH
jgi:hypothetical protein